jgi:hypothetical protein
MDPDDYRESAELFVTLVPTVSRDLRAFTVARDLAQLRVLAQRLVGTLGLFDRGASACAQRLEQALDDGHVDDLPGLVRGIEAGLAAMVARLASPEPAGAGSLQVRAGA